MAVRIKVLPEEIVNKIAAGEVVERPASVVKELVENALDAGGRDISIDIRGGGRSHIQVIDDGQGMNRDEALLSLERHATSKLTSAEDLFAIRTLGFRGEALAAIGGVSKLELVTRTADSAGATRILAHGGSIRSVDEVGAPVGTSISVRDLFFNTPARLKFMKSAAIEAGHIIDLVTRLALSHEGVAMKLVRGPETLLQVSAVTSGADRLVELLGPELVSHLHPFQGERAGVKVHGFLSAPDANRSGWAGLYAFVNRRFMRDRVITHAVGEAYRGVIPKGRYPIAVVYLEVDPAEVDVNVHPGKIEVRFARPRSVSDLIVEAMRGTLVRAPWRRTGMGRSLLSPESLFPEPGPEQPRQIEAAELLLQDILEERRLEGEGVPGAIPGAWVQDRTGDDSGPRGAVVSGATPADASVSVSAFPGAGVSAPTAPSASALLTGVATAPRQALEVGETATPEVAGQFGGPDEPGDPGASLSASLSASQPASLPAFQPASQPASLPASLPAYRSEPRASGDAVPSSSPALSGGPAWRPKPVTLAPEPDDEEERARLESLQDIDPGSLARTGISWERSAPVRARPREQSGILPGLAARNFSSMRIIGQYANCFILCQSGDELVIIDQHAAHERVTFEQLKAAYEGIGNRNQLLLTPHIVELPRREAELLTDYLDVLENLGLEVSHFGGNSFAVKAMPVVLQDEDPASLLSDLATDLAGDVGRKPLQDRIYLILATMACHGSIRANRKMAMLEMEALMGLLDGTDFSFACPHGRPLITRFTRREVEKLFKRT